MITNQSKKSDKLISSHRFENINLAIEFILNKKENGELIEVMQGINFINPDSENPVDIKYFKLETSNTIFNYTIKQFKNEVELEIYKTTLHSMITASERGDLDSFIASFDGSNKMVDFSADSAIKNNRLIILEYLIENNYQITNPIYRAITHDNIEALDYLIFSGNELYGDWLQHCLRNNSKNIIEEFLFKRKMPFNPTNPHYFRKLMNEKTTLIEEVKEFLTKEGIKL